MNKMQNRSLEKYVNTYFGELLKREDVTEICYNGDTYLFVLNNKGEWEKHDTNFSLQSVQALATAVSSSRDTEIKASKPILSATLNNKERVQIVRSPATSNDIVSITIRKPNTFKISMESYEEQKLFELAKSTQIKEDPLLPLYEKKDFKSFIELAVLLGKTIIIAGATGSGKTTFMKTLMDYIPKEERIITIEDVEELVFTEHENFVQLFYPSEAKSDSALNATTLLKSCLRMKPDRILLAELRGGETFDFINIINSGHSGSITSCHAGSVEETFRRLELMMLQNESGQKIPFPVIQETLRNTIDIVMHLADTKDGRRITSVYYKNAKKGNIK